MPTQTRVTAGPGAAARAVVTPEYAAGWVTFTVNRRWARGLHVAGGTVRLRDGVAAMSFGLLKSGEYTVKATYHPSPGSEWSLSKGAASFRVL